MKLKATKSFHASGLGTVHEGTEFEAHDALGQEIADKGLAEIVKASTPSSGGAAQTEPAAPKQPVSAAKAAPPVQNKAAEVQATKASAKPVTAPVAPDRA